MQIHMALQCNNVGGLGEHVICHVFLFDSIPFFFFTLFFSSRTGRTVGPILAICT